MKATGMHLNKTTYNDSHLSGQAFLPKLTVFTTKIESLPSKKPLMSMQRVFTY